ncbi:MAG: hypothetical protein U0796_20780 [Gemmatales bacterium]
MPVSLAKMMQQYTIILLCALLAVQCCTALDDQPKVTEAQHMEQWWADLTKSEPEGSRALLKFAFKFEKSVPFFKQQLKPARIDENGVKALLAKLGSENEAIWKAAFEQLEYFDPRLAIDLPTLMNDVTDKSTRSRMVEILSGRPAGSLQGKVITLSGPFDDGGYNFRADNGSWWAERNVERLNATYWGNRKEHWTRAVRVILLLDQIGSADALAIVREMATGHPDALPTRVAKEALAARAAKTGNHLQK